MAPLPARSSRAHWDDATRTEEMLPRTPTTPEVSEARQNNYRPQKDIKSPRLAPLSPLSTISSADECEEEKTRQKQTIDSPCMPQQTPMSCSKTPPTPRVKNMSRNKPGIKSVSISNHSPKTDLKHRQVAKAAAEAASLSRHRRSGKKLHWNSSVRVKVVHNMGNYTPQEKLDSWFTADEYSMMEDECELTSIHMDEIEFERETLAQEGKRHKAYRKTLPEGFCERGLESWTMQGEETKENQVHLIIDTVWQAQIDAWEFLGNHPSNGTVSKNTDNKSKNAIHNECWEFIREKCSEVSTPSTMRAQELAIKDEQDVDAYLNSVRSLEQSRRRITKMLLRGKHCSTRSINKSTKTLTTAKSCRTLTTVCSSDSRSSCVPDNLKSILKSPKPKRSNSDPKSIRRSPSQSAIPLNDIGQDDRRSFRIRLPKIGNDSSSMRSKSMRSNSMRSSSMRSNSLRSNISRSNSMRSNSLRSNISRSNSLRSNSLRSNNSRSNSMRSHSLRSQNSVRSNVSGTSFLSSSSSQKKIRYKPKSKTKIPTSPVGSVCNSLLSSQGFSLSNGTFSDEDSLSNRMMRSHMSVSVASEGSSRRRMLRVEPPL